MKLGALFVFTSGSFLTSELCCGFHISPLWRCGGEYAVFVDAELKAPALQWQYAANVTGDVYQDANPGFSNSPFANGAPSNTAYWFLYPLLLEAAGKQNIVVEQLLRIRVGAYVKNN